MASSLERARLTRRALMVGTLAAPAVIGTARAQGVTLRAGHVLAPTHQFHRGLEIAAQRVAEATGGRVRMQVFPSSQLGTERDMNIALRTGSVDMTLASPGGASVHLRELAVIDAPFLFRDNDHWQSVLAGPIGRGWEASIAERSGVHIVGWFHRGTRHVVSRNAPYETLGAIAGQKIRVADLPPYPQVFRAFGAVPTPIAFAEMYQALQSGVVDGADAPLDTIMAQKLFEVSRFVNLIAWSFAAPGPVLIGRNAWQRLSEADRRALADAVRAGSAFVTEAFTNGEEEVKRQLVANNMTLVTPRDPLAWRDAAARAIPGIASTWGGDADLYARIRDAR